MSSNHPYQPLTEHFIELRTRILRSVIGVLAIFLAMIPFSQTIYTFISTPLVAVLPEGAKMIAIDVTTPFLIPIIATLWIALFIAIPWVLYQLWAFVAPGLYSTEKAIVRPILISSILLFYAGMLFAYYAVMPLMFKFLASYTPENVEMATDINRYLSLVLRLIFFFGVAFETPIVVIILTALGIIKTDSVRKKRPYIIVGAFVVAAVVTPPDVFSQILFATAVLILFEAGLFFARPIEKRRQNR